jgi:hypothetical protein
MLNISDVEDFIYENFENVTQSKNGTHFQARCSICGDSKQSTRKKRFHLTYKEDNCIYNCFNCEASGDFYGLYAEFKNITRKEAWKRFHTYSTKNIRNKLKQKKKEKTVIEEKNYNNILKHCLSVNDIAEGHIEKKYLEILKKFIEDRNINIPIYISISGKYSGRFIIPVYKDNNIVYFQARSIYDEAQNKYLNPPSNKEFIIFNEENLDYDDNIYITEGILDAQSIEKNGTCCLGKEISDDWINNFIKKIKSDKIKNKIVIVLDNDKDGQKSLSKIINNSIYSNMLKYFIMPKKFSHIKDINMLRVKHENLNIKKFIDENSYSYWMLKNRELKNEINRNR